MRQFLDGMTAYMAAVMSLLFSYVSGTLETLVPFMMTIGGLVLLILRLYIDGSRAIKTYKENRND